MNGNQSILCSLVQGNWSENTTDSGFFHSAFWTFAEKSDIGMMHYLSEKPPGIDKFDRLGWTFAHTIAYAVHPDIIGEKATKDAANTILQVFNQNQASLFKFDKSGNLPTHLACQVNNSLILKLIIQSIEIKSPHKLKTILNEARNDKYWKQTPLMIAIRSNSIDCIKILCKQDSVIDSILHVKPRYQSHNALEFAYYSNNIGIFKLLLKCVTIRQNPKELIELKSQLSRLASNTDKRLNLRYSNLKHHCYDFVVGLLNSKMELSFKNLLSSLQNVSLNDTCQFFEQHTDKSNSPTDFTLLCRNGHELETTQQTMRRRICSCSVCNDTQISETKCCRKCENYDGEWYIYCINCATAETIWTKIVSNTMSNERVMEFITHKANNEIIKRVKCIHCKFLQTIVIPSPIMCVYKFIDL